MKKSEEDRLKCAINESTLSTAVRSPFPNGEGYDMGIPLFSHRQSEYMHMWKNNTDGQSLPLEGKVASEASRIGFWRCEKERGNASQAGDIREYPIHCCAVPLSRWGRLRNEDTAFLDTTPSPRGEGGERSEPDRVLAA